MKPSADESKSGFEFGDGKISWKVETFQLLVPRCSMYGIFTFRKFIGYMEVNIPYMEHLG